MADDQTSAAQPTETIDSFAQKIKAKYPDYAQMDNRELANKIITKYPEYKASIRPEEFGGGQSAPTGVAPKSLLQRVRDVMPEGFIRRGLEKGSEWAAGKQDQAYEGERQKAAQGESFNGVGLAKGAGYGMLSSLMRFGASAIQPSQKETAIGAATIAAPEIAGPLLVAHGLYTAGANASEALKGNPDAAESALMGASEAAGGGAMAGGAVTGGLRNTATGKLMKAAKSTVIDAKPPQMLVPEAQKALTQAIQPGVNIPRAQESIGIAGPRLQQLRQAGALTDLEGNPISEIKTTGQQLGAVRSAKAHVLKAIEDRLGPVDALQVDTSGIAEEMRNSISKRTRTQYPQQAARIEARAATYEQPQSLRDLENAIIDANDDLKGFYRQPVAGESSVSADIKGTLAEVKRARSLLDEKVEALSGEGVKDLKREYGALRDVERATARQHAVATRTKEGGLWEGLAYLHAAGDLTSGNALGAARAVGALTVGRMLKTLRNPDFLIEQSFHGPKAFEAAEPIGAAQKPPVPPEMAKPGQRTFKGTLPAPPTEAGFTQEDTSGSARDPEARWATPKAALPSPETPTIPAKFLRVISKQRPKSPLRLLRESNTPSTDVPPMVDERFAQEATGTVSDPNRLGARGQGGVRTTPKGELSSMAGHYERARGLVQQTLDMLRSGDRPGRYYDENEMGEYNPQKEQSSARGVTSGGRWRGVKSMRDMLPWLNETEFTPAELERALRMAEKGKASPVLNSALEYVKRQGNTPREPGEEAPF